MPLKYTPADPLVVRIGKNDDGVWDIGPDSKHDREMSERKAKLKANDIDKEWRKRRAAGSPPLTHFSMHPDHKPVIFFEGETLEFVCDKQFAIWADRDPNVSADEDAPGNPFGWHVPEISPTGCSIQAQVRTKSGPNAKGPRDQRFYKFAAWVYDESPGPGMIPETIAIDPDGYCGDG